MRKEEGEGMSDRLGAAPRRVSADLEVVESGRLSEELGRAKPWTEGEAREWARVWRRGPYSNEERGGRLGARYLMRWDEEGFDGPCLRALSRDYGLPGRPLADGFRVMGRVFARVSLAALGERDAGLGVFDEGWSCGFELRLVESPREWAMAIARERARFRSGGREGAEPMSGDWPLVELTDPEELCLALRESWELEESVREAPARPKGRV